jgi:thiol-disulfide isomerase/thioredoxin
MLQRIFLIWLIYSLFFVSCKDKTKTYTPAVTVVEGQLASVENPLITLQTDVENKAPIDPSGNFVLTAKIDRPGLYKIIADHSEINLFLIPGAKVSLTGDIRNPNTFKFKGTNALENNYLVQYESLKSSSPDQDFTNFFSQNETNFINAVEQRTQAFLSDQQSYQKDNGTFNDEFAELMMDELQYDGANLKLNYPDFHDYLKPDSALVMSDTYDSFLQNLEIDDESKLAIPAFQTFLTLYLTFKTTQEKTDSLTPFFAKKFNNIGIKFQNSKIKDLLYYLLMKDGLQTSINDAAATINDFNKLEKNQKYLDEINTEYAKWTHLLKGKPSPTWSYKDANGVKHSNTSYQGKVVYIDIWASWCGPCLRELPFIHTLEEQYKDKVAFVSISIDASKDEWLDILQSKKLKGSQLIADADWHSSIVTDYRIDGIPRFIILAKDGTIYNANAPRPSSKEIRAELNAALEFH